MKNIVEKENVSSDSEFAMEQAKALLDKILSNEITAFLFVFACAVGAFIGVAGGYWLAFKTVVFIGAY